MTGTFAPLLEHFHDQQGIGEMPQSDAAAFYARPLSADVSVLPKIEPGVPNVGRAMLLPSDPAARKDLPITTGVLDYFPRALAEVARVSKAGSEQHHPGQPLHWEKGKSTDHADCISRHLIDRFSRDSDGMRHAAKLAWRALALLETLLENESDGV